MTQAPLLALVSRLGDGSPGVRALVRALGGLVDVRALDRCPRRPDAALATSERAASGAPEGVALAVVVGSSVRIEGDDVPLPSTVVDIAGARPHAVPVRRRWRERLGRPEPWVVDLERLPGDQRQAAAEVASVVVAHRADLVVALARGAPTVTDAPSAAAVGAVDGTHVLVAAPGEPAISAAHALAADPVRSARLSTAGRALVEQRLDVARTAAELVRRLGLISTASAYSLVDARLAELATLPGAPVRRRVAAALAVLDPPTAPVPEAVR